MIIVLLIVAAVAGVLGVMEGEGLPDTFVIPRILVLNAFFAAIQEKKGRNKFARRTERNNVALLIEIGLIIEL